MSGRNRMRIVLGGLVLGATLLGGCKNVSKADYDAALAENRELRERLASLQGTVNEANDQTGRLSSETQSLADENSRLRSEVDRLRSAAANQQNTASRSVGNSGFEGIAGVQGVTSRGEGLSVEVAGDVLFDSGSATLKNSAKQALDQIASVIGRTYSNNRIRVEGYTDTDPLRRTRDRWKSNERLSSERALAVEEYLVSKGVPGDRIYAAAFGPANPKATKKESRRVEIVILGS